VKFIMSKHFNQVLFKVTGRRTKKIRKLTTRDKILSKTVTTIRSYTKLTNPVKRLKKPLDKSPNKQLKLQTRKTLEAVRKQRESLNNEKIQLTKKLDP
jgi:plasmid maintenance system antidote protein VapI